MLCGDIRLQNLFNVESHFFTYKPGDGRKHSIVVVECTDKDLEKIIFTFVIFLLSGLLKNETYYIDEIISSIWLKWQKNSRGKSMLLN
jgi:hypothetical protein